MDSSSAGDWVGLGIYDDEELRLISFFHELGHYIDGLEAHNLGKRCVENSDHPYHHYGESSAWRTGLKIATKYGVSFSKNTIDWSREQLKSYFEDNHPEKSPMKFFEKAESYAFGGKVKS